MEPMIETRNTLNIKNQNMTTQLAAKTSTNDEKSSSSFLSVNVTHSDSSNITSSHNLLPSTPQMQPFKPATTTIQPLVNPRNKALQKWRSADDNSSDVNNRPYISDAAKMKKNRMIEENRAREEFENMIKAKKKAKLEQKELLNVKVDDDEITTKPINATITTQNQSDLEAIDCDNLKEHELKTDNTENCNSSTEAYIKTPIQKQRQTIMKSAEQMTDIIHQVQENCTEIGKAHQYLNAANEKIAEAKAQAEQACRKLDSAYGKQKEIRIKGQEFLQEIRGMNHEGEKYNEFTESMAPSIVSFKDIMSNCEQPHTINWTNKSPGNSNEHGYWFWILKFLHRANCIQFIYFSEIGLFF